MSAQAIASFIEYFGAFEAALKTDDWSAVSNCLTENARYTVEGVPFACDLHGRQAIVRAMQKSTSAFDATMDFRMLEIQSMIRVGAHCMRVDLISGYGRENIGSVTAPVTIEVTTNEDGIVSLKDIYDPELTAPALTWLAINCADANPSYL